ncbi:MAG TPA: GNAT family protein [Egibacteraceae bacterium]|nr:GNAT family protein [Egibacteraceae bacterium]
MLRGDRLHLRTVRERDLDNLYVQLNALEHRGSYFPVGLQAEPVFRRKFDEDGFWGSDDGMLLMIDPGDQVVGEIEFYPITPYLTGYELSYLVFGPDHRGKGYATEAVGLLTAYLFARLRIDRVQLNIHPDNQASRRVAEKAGYTLEGVMRSCWFNRGEFHDLQIWSMLRREVPAQ